MQIRERTGVERVREFRFGREIAVLNRCGPHRGTRENPQNLAATALQNNSVHSVE